MTPRTSSVRKALTLTLSGLMVAGLSTPARAAGEPVEPLALTAAIDTADCDPDGTTSADATLAGQLSGTLDDKLANAMTAYRVSCARVITETVRDRDLSKRAAVIAVTTAIVETGLKNYTEAVDHTSLGLFQQQNPWGSAANRINPVWATNAFLNKMEDVYPNGSWANAPIGAVAQAVQVSAYPDRYAVEAGDAAQIVDAVWPYAADLRLGSVSGDDRADLLVHGVDGVISHRVNQGTWFDGGTVRSQGWSNFMGYNGSGKLYFADIDGDRKTDLLVHGTDGVISVRYNKGTYWDAGTTISQGWSNFLGYPGKGRLYFADFNGDSRADMIVHGVGGDISVRINQGTWFDGGTNISNGWSNFMGYNNSGKLYFTDINGDRKTDLLVHSTDGVISVRYNQGTYWDAGRTLTQGWGNFLGYPDKGKLYFADINADGRSDLLVHGTDGAIHVRYNQGTWFDGGTLITQGWGNFMGYNNSGQLYFA
jgi:hypothetical protein